MKTPQPVPTGYTKLPFGSGAILQAGDWVMWEGEGDITKLTGEHPYVGRSIDSSGMRPSEGQVFFYVRPIASAPQGWISVKDRLPEGKFAEAGGGFVFAIKNHDIHTAIYETAYHIANHAKTRGFTHWMPIPPLPPKPAIKVGEHKVDFRKDGSIKVGCTEVSSELFEQIAARRKEEMQ